MTEHFLIADREPLVSEECRRFLSARGYSAVTAADSAQCLEQIQHKAPTVLIVDAALLWGGSENILRWLSTQTSQELLVFLVIDRDGSGPLPQHLRSLVAGRLERPRSLQEIELLIGQLLEVVDGDHEWNVPSDNLSTERVYH